MWKELLRARDRFGRDQRGNLGILFAFSAIPLVGLLGGAVDMTRYTRHKTQILNTMDSAAIALARSGIADDGKADTFVNDYIAAVLPNRDPMLKLGAFDAIKTETGWRVTSRGAMATAFMPVVGIDRMLLDLEAEVSSGGKYEIALVLDNTGSMAERGKIDALKTASTDLIDIIYTKLGAGSRVKTALVPFVTAVNIKGEAFDPSWIDRAGATKHATDNFERPVDRIALFQQIGAAWKGCVEARESAYDLDDTPPDGPQTRFLPYFWPDDSDVQDEDRYSYSYSNNYLDDGDLGAAGVPEHLRNVDKYQMGNKLFRRFDETPKDTNGPNKSCAGPIVELTQDVDRMTRAIGQMAPHGGSGTNVAQGMAWGWRVLSPDEPFTQGAPYDDGETIKAMVVLTDGRNEIFGDYTGYGHLDDGRLGDSQPAALAQANRNVETLCKRIRGKENGGDDRPDRIRIYTIVFQLNDARTQEIFERCASLNADGKPLYYFAPNNATLQLAFQDIGDDITSLHVSR